MSPEAWSLFSVLIVTREKKSAAELRQRLGREGLTCAIEDDATRLVEHLVEDAPDLLLWIPAGGRRYPPGG